MPNPRFSQLGEMNEAEQEMWHAIAGKEVTDGKTSIKDPFGIADGAVAKMRRVMGTISPEELKVFSAAYGAARPKKLPVSPLEDATPEGLAQRNAYFQAQQNAVQAGLQAVMEARRANSPQIPVGR
jgi:hypothetical protein